MGWSDFIYLLILATILMSSAMTIILRVLTKPGKEIVIGTPVPFIINQDKLGYL